MKVCDNCLTAAYDEAVGMGFIHEANNREFLEVMCIELGADIADHVCLVSLISLTLLFITTYKRTLTISIGNSPMYNSFLYAITLFSSSIANL